MNPARADQPKNSLFDWREQRQISAINAERDSLCETISKLPKLSHRRITLEERLRQKTNQLLQMQMGGKQ